MSSVLDPNRTAWRSRRIWKLLTMAASLDRVNCYIEDSAGPLAVWRETFASELDVVSRARNNIVWQDWISDDNLGAACKIARTLIETHSAAADAAGALDEETA
jgi:hypothetical protein